MLKVGACDRDLAATESLNGPRVVLMKKRMKTEWHISLNFKLFCVYSVRN